MFCRDEESGYDVLIRWTTRVTSATKRRKDTRRFWMSEKKGGVLNRDHDGEGSEKAAARDELSTVVDPSGKWDSGDWGRM